MIYPKELERTIALLGKLPGVGERTAQRYAFSLMNTSEDTINELSDAVKGLLNIKRCKCCGFVASEDLCNICKEERENVIMIISYDQDLVAVERTEGYRGKYHILNGIISASKGTYPEDLNIESLWKRVDEENIDEVIIATPFTSEGEMTALYLDRILKQKKIKTSRLAHGLPTGANLEYADEWTLLKALNNRREMEDNNE